MAIFFVRFSKGGRAAGGFQFFVLQSHKLILELHQYFVTFPNYQTVKLLSFGFVKIDRALCLFEYVLLQNVANHESQVPVLDVEHKNPQCIALSVLAEKIGCLIFVCALHGTISVVHYLSD